MLALGTFAYAGPYPLEDAYWRFEEGQDGALVPQGENTVLDSINENHLQRWTAPDGDPDRSAPIYTSEVPASIIPQTGKPNTLALRFMRNPEGGGDDIYCDGGKHIGHPINDKGFTLEASFKVTFVGGGADKFQGIVCKEGAIQLGLPRLVLKIRGDDGTLQIEMFDESNTVRSIRSLDPILPNQWYHAAVVNDGSTLSLYLKSNGNYVLQGTAPLSGVLSTGASGWVIGRGQYYDNPADWTDGIIDEVRLSNRPLSPDEFLFAEGYAPGDFDHNRRVDIEDMLILLNCATGPAIAYDPESPPPDCPLTADDEGRLAADLDKDGDIDCTDFAMFQVLLSP